MTLADSSAWTLDGPNNSPVRECDRALKRLHTCEQRPPTEDDRPPLATFPMTKAAREALRLNREPVVSKARRRALTYGDSA